MHRADCYAELGLPSSATIDEVKAAYRRLARELHPDLNPDPEAALRLEAVNQAYNVLISSAPATRPRARETVRRTRPVPVVSRPPVVVDWSPEKSDAAAKEIRSGHEDGEYVIAADRFDIEEVSGKDGRGRPFAQLALCIDGCVLESIEGEVESHDLANVEHHRRFAKQHSEVKELFWKLGAEQSGCAELVRDIKRGLPWNSRVWLGDVRYQHEQVQAEDGPVWVLTRAGRILDDCGKLREHRRRASLNDFLALREDASFIKKNAEAMRNALSQDPLGEVREFLRAGDRQWVYTSSGRAEYWYHTVVCGEARYPDWLRIGDGPHPVPVRTTRVKPSAFVPPPYKEPLQVPEGDTVYYADILFRNGRPVELTDRVPLSPELLGGFDSRELAAFQEELKQIRNSFRWIADRRREQARQAEAAARSKQYWGGWSGSNPTMPGSAPAGGTVPPAPGPGPGRTL